MSKSNLGQYAKIGFGLDLLVEGALGVYGNISQNTAMVQEVFHRAEQIGLDTMHRANDLVYNFAIGEKNLEVILFQSGLMLFQSGLIIGGGMLLSSGIYNLVNKYKAPTKE